MSNFDWRTFHRDQRDVKRHAQTTANLASTLMKLNPDNVQGRVTQAIATKELAAAIDVSIIEANSAIDPFIIYCSVTGRPIGRRAEETVRLALQVHGVSKVEELVKFNAQSCVSEHWMMQSGRDLGKLAESDPYGYFVFASAKAYQRYFKNLMEKKEDDNAEAQFQLLKQKILLFQKLQAIDVQTIVRANEAWRNFLSLIDPAYVRHAIVFPCLVLGDFANPEIISYLEHHLETTLAELMWRETQYKGRIGVSDISSMGDKYKGLGVFKAQARLTGEDESDFIARLLAENSRDFIPMPGAKSHGSSWQRRTENAVPKRPKFEGQSHTIDTSKAFAIKISATPAVIHPKLSVTQTGENTHTQSQTSGATIKMPSLAQFFKPRTDK